MLRPRERKKVLVSKDPQDRSDLKSYHDDSLRSKEREMLLFRGTLSRGVSAWDSGSFGQ